MERVLCPQASGWALLVRYRAGSSEFATRLSLSSDDVAMRVDRLLAATRLGNRTAARDLFACLHAEWGVRRVVDRDPAWDAVFRYLAPRAAQTAGEPTGAGRRRR